MPQALKSWRTAERGTTAPAVQQAISGQQLAKQAVNLSTQPEWEGRFFGTDFAHLCIKIEDY